MNIEKRSEDLHVTIGGIPPGTAFYFAGEDEICLKVKFVGMSCGTVSQLEGMEGKTMYVRLSNGAVAAKCSYVEVCPLPNAGVVREFANNA